MALNTLFTLTRGLGCVIEAMHSVRHSSCHHHQPAESRAPQHTKHIPCVALPARLLMLPAHRAPRVCSAKKWSTFTTWCTRHWRRSSINAARPRQQQQAAAAARTRCVALVQWLAVLLPQLTAMQQRSRAGRLGCG